MKYKFLKSILFSAVVALSVTSCIKDDVTEAGDVNAGTTFVKISEAQENPLFFSVFDDIKTVDLFSIRRDAISSEDLNTPTTVKLKRVDALIEAYNDANGETFEVLPDSIYTANVALNGDTYDMSLGSGEFAKEFTIQLNGAKWDIAHKYALAVVLSDIGGKVSPKGMDTVITFISVKNKWDGAYELTGYHNRDPYNFPYEVTMHLATVGPTKVAFYWPDAGSYGHPIGIDVGEVSWYGASIAPIIEFDPETDKIINVYNGYSGGTAISLYTDDLGGPDPAEANLYDPETKTVYVSWMYGGNTSRAFFDKLKYIGSR